MERTIYERADGVPAARLSAPAASQRPDCSSASRGACGASEGRKGGTALSTLPWRLRVLVPHVGSTMMGYKSLFYGRRLSLI